MAPMLGNAGNPDKQIRGYSNTIYMKLNFKKTSLLAAGLMAAGNLFAQTPDSAQTKNYVEPFSNGNAFRTWSFGVGAGVLSGYTVLGGKQDFKGYSEQLGFSAYLKKQILPSLGIEADYMGGQVKGSGTPTIAQGNAYTSYTANIEGSAALQANITLANINWRHNKAAIQPYATFGGGAIWYSTSASNANGQPQPLLTANAPTASREFFIPVGLGFKFDIAPGVNLDLGYQVNFVNSDTFDGYAFQNNNDKFSYAHAGLEFALGSRRKPQLATHNPVSSMRYEYLMKAKALQDQVDMEKAKNEQLRSDLNTTNGNLAAINAKLTADSDGDGVPDLFDKCPNTPAGTKVDGAGCPLPVAQNVKVYVTEEDKKVVKDAIANLEFDLGKATIRAHSLPSLNKVAELLVSKNFSLKLAGHTDNTGSAALNMRLSKERAEAIKTYLVTQGANASRIEAVGYGMTQPIATNKTAAGRQDNRRVEFTLY